MKRFTKEEMHAAWQQAGDQQREAQDKAEKALSWISQKCDFHWSSKIEKDYGWATLGPEPIPYHLTFIHETYGPGLADYTTVLDQKSWAKKISPAVEPRYEVETPFGTFKLSFEYFDNHCCGY